MIGAALTFLFIIAALASVATLADSAIKARDAMRRILRELSNGD